MKHAATGDAAARIDAALAQKPEASNAILKIFVRRDTERNLVPDQHQRFEALRSSLV